MGCCCCCCCAVRGGRLHIESNGDVTAPAVLCCRCRITRALLAALPPSLTLLCLHKCLVVADRLAFRRSWPAPAITWTTSGCATLCSSWPPLWPPTAVTATAGRRQAGARHPAPGMTEVLGDSCGEGATSARGAGVSMCQFSRLRYWDCRLG